MTVQLTGRQEGRRIDVEEPVARARNRRCQTQADELKKEMEQNCLEDAEENEEEEIATNQLAEGKRGRRRMNRSQQE